MNWQDNVDSLVRLHKADLLADGDVVKIAGHRVVAMFVPDGVWTCRNCEWSEEFNFDTEMCLVCMAIDQITGKSTILKSV